MHRRKKASLQQEMLMKHKTFEEWIFLDEVREKEDQKALYDHLRDCDECYLLEKRWREIEPLLVAAPIAGPANGFAERWQARLVLENRRAVQRQNLVIFISTSVTAALLLFLIALQFSSRIADALSPVAIWGAAISRLSAQALAIVGDTFELLMSASPAAFLMLLVMAFFASLGSAALLWLKMFRTLARVQGVTRWA